jgi:transposase InsO family protein
MLKGVESYGTSKKKIHRRIQGSYCSTGALGDTPQGALPGVSASSSNNHGLAMQVPRGQEFSQAQYERKDSSSADREATSQDWGADNDHRPFKKTRREYTTTEKRRWVRDHLNEFGTISKACKAIGISVSSFYYKPKVDPKTQARRDSDLRDLIEKIQAKFPQYGVRQLYWELLWGYGQRINKKRIHRVMRESGLRAQIYRGFKVSTTDSNHSNRIYPNLLHGKEVTGLNQVWVTDITYVRIQTCFVYLSAILDLFSRKVIGWSVSKKIHTDLCLESLKMAIENRRPGSGVIHHSDRGVQYTSDAYVELLKSHDFQISMSRKGNCWDNAHMESFFGTLKQEELYLKDYETFSDVILGISNFIEEIYNEKRRKGALGGLTPVEFETKWQSGELQKLGIPSMIKLWDGSSK